MKPCRNPDCPSKAEFMTCESRYCRVEGCSNYTDGRICDQHAFEQKVCAFCLKSRKDRHKDRNK